MARSGGQGKRVTPTRGAATVQSEDMLAELVQALRVWADGAGGLGVFAIALLDSSILALPNATDALIMYLTLQHPAWWWYYAGMGIAGVIVGSWPLYVVARRGGEAFVRRRLSGPRAASALAFYRRSAFLAIALPAFTPPPMPLKIFVLLAGATAFAPWRVASALALGRGGRHAIEAGLAAAYRDDAIRAFERYGPSLAIGVLVAVTLACAGIYAWHVRRTP